MTCIKLVNTAVIKKKLFIKIWSTKCEMSSAFSDMFGVLFFITVLKISVLFRVCQNRSSV